MISSAEITVTEDGDSLVFRTKREGVDTTATFTAMSSLQWEVGAIAARRVGVRSARTGPEGKAGRRDDQAGKPEADHRCNGNPHGGNLRRPSAGSHEPDQPRST